MMSVPNKYTDSFNVVNNKSKNNTNKMNETNNQSKIGINPKLKMGSKGDPYDVLIIGAGISGLATANDLKKRNPNLSILILEKSSRLGGRIRSQYIPKLDHNFEAGAARISYAHTNTINLLNELDLSSDIEKITNKRDYMLRNNYTLLTSKNIEKINELYNIRSDEFPPKVHRYIQEVIHKSEELQPYQIRQLTFQALCQEFLTSEAIQFMIDAFGYNAEFETLNAWDAIQVFKGDFSEDSQYFIVKRGLSELVYRLADKLIAQGVEIHKESMLFNFFWDNKLRLLKAQIDRLDTERNEDIFAKKIVLALPTEALTRIPGLYHYHSDIKSVEAIPLMRIYAVYPRKNDGKVWFHDIPNVTTDNIIRQIIPINYEKGIVMISYSDSRYANMWSGFQSQGEDALADEVNKQLKRLFPYKRIPEPLMLKGYFWSAGCHYWLPGINSRDMAKKIRQLNETVPLYICGEAYSHHQAWIEGALDTALDVARLIEPNTPKNYNKVEIQELKANSDEIEKILTENENKNKTLDDIPREPEQTNQTPNHNVEKIDTNGDELPSWDQTKPDNDDDEQPKSYDTREQTTTEPEKAFPNKTTNNNDITFRVGPNGTKYFKMKEVYKHNRPSDAWLVINGKVYDVTSWIPQHPGGKVILKGIGKDATTLFNRIGHSQHAHQILNKYYIGNLDQ